MDNGIGQACYPRIRIIDKLKPFSKFDSILGIS